MDQKNRKGAKKIFEVKFSISLHKLASGSLSLSFFSYLKRNPNLANFSPFYLSMMEKLSLKHLYISGTHQIQREILIITP